jgi:hypothetical protein
MPIPEGADGTGSVYQRDVAVLMSNASHDRIRREAKDAQEEMLACPEHMALDRKPDPKEGDVCTGNGKLLVCPRCCFQKKGTHANHEGVTCETKAGDPCKFSLSHCTPQHQAGLQGRKTKFTIKLPVLPPPVMCQEGHIKKRIAPGVHVCRVADGTENWVCPMRWAQIDEHPWCKYQAVEHHDRLDQQL